MFFSHWPFWAIALAFFLIFLVKHFLVQWLLRTNVAIANTQGQGWIGALITNAALNGVLDVIFLFFFTSWHIAVVIGLLDALLHYVLGYWKKRQHLPKVTPKTLSTVYTVVEFIHGTSYLGLAAYVLQHLKLGA